MDRKRVFIHSKDTELAVKLVKLLDKHGVTALWLTQEEAEKLERLWQWDACIRQVHEDGSLEEVVVDGDTCASCQSPRRPSARRTRYGL